jgi:hypothetical protein
MSIVIEKCGFPLVFNYMEMSLFFEKMYSSIKIGISSLLRLLQIIQENYSMKFGVCFKEKYLKRYPL